MNNVIYEECKVLKQNNIWMLAIDIIISLIKFYIQIDVSNGIFGINTGHIRLLFIY